MRSRIFTVFAILLVSFIIAALTAPPDPFSWCVTAAAVFVASLLCYVVGKRQGRAALPSDLDGNRRLGRLQFGLGTLLGILTLAAILAAGIAWHRQLERRRMDADQLMSVHDVVEQQAKKVGLESRSYMYCYAAPIAYSNQCWGAKSGLNALKPDFEYTVINKISDRLRELGAQTEVFTPTGIVAVPPMKSCFFARVQYRYGSVRGTVVLCLVLLNDENGGGTLTLEHDQFR